VVDQDRSTLSREIITALDNTQELEVTLFPANLREGRQLIDDGEITGLVIIPPDFEAQTETGIDVPQIQVILDGTQIVTAARALGAAQNAVTSLGHDVVVARAGGAISGGIELAAEALYNRALNHVPHSVTAQFAFVTFQITALVSVMGIVRERELGTLEMLSITPLQRLEIIAGKAITPFLIGTLDFFVMYGVTQIIFGVENRGSFPLLIVLTLLYLVSEIGFSLMISTITRTQQQAVTAVFIWAMLCITLSGYMVPVERLPAVLRTFSTIVPLRHYLAIVRGIILKGAGVGALWPHIVALIGLGIGMIFLTRRTLTRVIE
jgi:ABC-2 type transport system permease protein